MLLACVSGAAACTWVCTLSTAVLPRASTSASVLRANGRVCKCQRRANGRRANIGHPCAMHEAGGTQVCTTSTDLCMHKCVCKSARTQGVCVCVCACGFAHTMRARGDVCIRCASKCVHCECACAQVHKKCVQEVCIHACAHMSVQACACTGSTLTLQHCGSANASVCMNRAKAEGNCARKGGVQRCA